jgi:hypothetical protein
MTLRLWVGNIDSAWKFPGSLLGLLPMAQGEGHLSLAGSSP